MPLPREPRRFARALRQGATSAEDAPWRALRGRKLVGLKFKRQAPFLACTVDFLCFERKLIVELDGRQHAWFSADDRLRTGEIERSGFTVLRFANAEVLTDLDAVLSRITGITDAAAGPPAPAHPHPCPSPIRETESGS